MDNCVYAVFAFAFMRIDLAPEFINAVSLFC